MARKLGPGVLGAMAVLVLGASCEKTPLPGTMLGTYRVTGKSVENTCGLSAPDPWTFDVQISHDGSLLYWSWLDGSAPLSGPLSSSSSASLTTSQQANVDGADGGLGPCTLQRDDDVEVTLGAGSPPGGFTGTVTYAFSATAGSDCSDQLASATGTYARLPCAISYSVTGQRQ